MMTGYERRRGFAYLNPGFWSSSNLICHITIFICPRCCLILFSRFSFSAQLALPCCFPPEQTQHLLGFDPVSKTNVEKKKSVLFPTLTPDYFFPFFSIECSSLFLQSLTACLWLAAAFNCCSEPCMAPYPAAINPTSDTAKVHKTLILAGGGTFWLWPLQLQTYIIRNSTFQPGFNILVLLINLAHLNLVFCVFFFYLG